MAKEKAYQVTIVRGKWIKIENEISQTKSNLLEIIRLLFFCPEFFPKEIPMEGGS